MTKKKNKKPTMDDILKYEIATELGLSSKVDSIGWAGLTAAETGKIGGILSSRKRKAKKAESKKEKFEDPMTLS